MKTRRTKLFLAIASVAFLFIARPAVAQENADLDSRKKDIRIAANSQLDVTVFLQNWSETLGVPIIYDPTVKGTKLNFLTTVNEMTWGMAKKILDFHDIVVQEQEATAGSGRWIMFVHQRRNVATRLPPPFKYVDLRKESLPKREEVVTAVVQIVHGAGADIYSNIRGLLTRDVNRISNILYVRGPEVFIIVDFASNVEYYVKIIRALDVQAPGQVIKIRQITYAPAAELATVLSSVLRATAGQPGVGPMPIVPAAGAGQQQSQVMADQRTNKLIIQAFDYQFEEIDRLIGELDIRVTQKLGRFHVYKCRDTDAQYLSGKISQLFGAQGGAAGTTRGRTPAARPSGGAPGAGTPGGGGPIVLTPTGAPGQAGANDFNKVETRIVADELTNSLLIQADEENYRQILELLTQLDQKRRRVAIEARVFEISTPTDQLTIGVELAGLNNAHQGSFRGNAISNFGLSTINVDPVKQTVSRLPNIQQGAAFALTKDSFDKIPVIVEAVANFSDAKLVTSPFAITNDNEQAKFTIDNQVPFLTSNLAGSGISQQSVQTVDAKSELQITPQVNSEENLTLNFSLVLASFGAQPNPQLPPSTQSRSYEGTVTVPNQKWVVFGGLESDSVTTTETKVPFLGDIPILGHLFKNWSRSRTKSQVYIFVRPTIFSDPKSRDLGRATDELMEKAHIDAGREEWIPPIISASATRNPLKGIQDEAFEVFGSGSGNPFGASPKDE